MKPFLIALGVVVLAAVVVIAVWIFGLRRMVDVVGKPTPEEARVKVEKAEDKAKAATEKKVEEIRNAPLEDNLRRARDLIDRGLRK